MLKRFIFLALVFTIGLIPNTLHAEQTLTAVKVDIHPRIDGEQNDPVWEKAKPLVTHDKVAGIDLTIRCVYDDANIYFLVTYPDPDESRSHKPWIWNRDKEMYEMGPQREDVFVLKWSMENGVKVDLSVHSDTPYTADIWFWKACRTDPAGFADDKIQVLSPSQVRKSKTVISKSGKTFYLKRSGDKGKAAYRSEIKVDHQGDITPQFVNQTPKGSRADIKAKGKWADGRWIIEFSRPIRTDAIDDIQFDPKMKYLFGASRFEIAGREPNSKLTQPLYGSGDVSEALYLAFSQ